MLVKFLLLLYVSFSWGVPLTSPPPNQAEFCSYESCHPTKDGFINVHIVPHTHDDVGWLKTIDQYYYGSNTLIQKAGVQYILDSVVDALKKDTNRRFIYVETAYLWKWWMEQHDFVKYSFKKFINNGQLEIIGGAWSMNDEAATHYQSIIDQFTWGLRKINDTFGKCGRPKVGWQIDPFGHSREMASIFSQLGYDGLLLGRIDYQDKQNKFATKSAEFVWQGSSSLGEKSNIFTSVMYNTYSPPPGFCFDILCADKPIIDDKRSPDYNVDERFEAFINYMKLESSAYQTNNIIVTMGGDFTYMDANTWFKNIDKLIRYGNLQQNNGSNYNLIYSTPSCYLKAVHDAGEGKINWYKKTDDFFPYASDPNSYWTGYFTSRPTIKRFERVGNNYLQVCKQLYSLVDLGPEDYVDLNVLREAMGVMQHHDAITGTEKEHVAHDYSRLLSMGFSECDFITATALSQLVTGNNETVYNSLTPEIPFQSCHLSNVSQCAFVENSDAFITTVYNPLSRPVSHHVRLPITGKRYEVKDPQGNIVATQIVPIAKPILKIPGRNSKATDELIFLAENIPPMGFKSYYVEKQSSLKYQDRKTTKENTYNVELAVDKTTGKLLLVKMNNQTLHVVQDFYYYRGTVGNNEIPLNRSSGAYIFRPNGTFPTIVTNSTSYQLHQGEIVTELQQIFNDWISQTIRIYKSENLVEFDWLIGPIPNDTSSGKEIITKYTSTIESDSMFYTDSNGREMLKRIRNFRPTFILNLTEPISGNYYPVTTKILLKDIKKDLEMAIMVDRAQGGSSLKDGEIELMLHRTSLNDDAFGVGEPLNEQAFNAGLVVRGSHYMVLGSQDSTNGKSVASIEKDIAQRKLLSAWTFVSPTNNVPYDDYKSKFKMEFSGLKTSLPDNVQILTLEPWKAWSYLLRLEHVYEKGEDKVLSKPVTVDLKDLFTPFSILSYKETTVGANQWLDENERLSFTAGAKMEELVESNNFEWNNSYLKLKPESLKRNAIIEENYSTQNSVEEVEIKGDFKIVLEPMQIRTFVVEIKDSN